MKISSVIIQNKRGQNIFVVSANDFPHEDSLKYSKEIYNQILSQFKAGRKVDRQYALDSNYICVCNLTKEAIFIVIVHRNGVFLAHDAMKRLSDFFAMSAKLEITTRKYQEMLLLLDEFLYTRELVQQKLQFNFLKPNAFSSKSIVDCDHLSKFPNIPGEIERNLIANIPLKYAKKQQLVERQNDIISKFIVPFGVQECQNTLQEMGWVQKHKQFAFKCAFQMKTRAVTKVNTYNKYQHQTSSIKKTQSTYQNIAKQCMSISSSDIQIMKQRFQGQMQKSIVGFQDMFNQYQKNTPNQQIMQSQLQVAKPVNLLGQDVHDIQPTPISTIPQQQPMTQVIQIKPQSINDLLELDYKPQQPKTAQNSMSLIPNDISFHTNTPATQMEVQLKMLEKMMLVQKDGKLKEIKIFGQIALEGDLNDDQASLQLMGQGWHEPGSQRRITPHSIDLKPINESSYRMPIKQQSYTTPKGIIDYIVPIKLFNQQRLPLLFIYRLESQQGFSSFCLQYKVNENWQAPLYDVDIEVNLDKDVEYDDLKTTPTANSVQGNKILWKAKYLQSNYRGRLILNLLGLKKCTTQLLQYIRLSVKSNATVIEDMNCVMFYNVQEYKCAKRLSTEYKILPNS